MALVVDGLISRHRTGAERAADFTRGYMLERARMGLGNFGACGDPAWLTLPSGESVSEICGGGMLEVCTGTHVKRWADQAARLKTSLEAWRPKMVAAAQQANDPSKAAPLLGKFVAWSKTYGETPKQAHWSKLGSAERAQALANLVSEGACLLQMMQQETQRLAPGSAPPVDPGPVTPGPPVAFNDPFAFAGFLILAYFLATQVDWS